MPKMSGVELQDHLSQSGIDIPIIFITAHDNKESRRQALQAGAVAFLGKPFSDELLLQTIRAALRRDETSTCGVRYGEYQQGSIKRTGLR